MLLRQHTPLFSSYGQVPIHTHAPLINGLNVMPAFYTSLAALFTYWPALDTFWATSLTLPTILPTLGFASDIKPRAIVPPASSALPNPLYKNPRTVLTPFVNLCVRKFIPLIVILYNIIKKSGGKKIFLNFISLLLLINMASFFFVVPPTHDG